jgi:hypothetical protein
MFCKDTIIPTLNPMINALLTETMVKTISVLYSMKRLQCLWCVHTVDSPIVLKTLVGVYRQGSSWCTRPCNEEWY